MMGVDAGRHPRVNCPIWSNACRNSTPHWLIRFADESRLRKAMRDYLDFDNPFDSSCPSGSCQRRQGIETRVQHSL